MSEAVEFRVVRTKADYVGAVALHALRSPWTLRQFLASPIIVAIVPFIFAADEPLKARMILSATFFAAGLSLLIVALLPCYYWAARSGWRSPGALQPIDYAFNDEGMRVRSAVGSGEIGWISFSGAFEDTKLSCFGSIRACCKSFPSAMFSLKFCSACDNWLVSTSRAR